MLNHDVYMTFSYVLEWEVCFCEASWGQIQGHINLGMLPISRF